MLDEYRTTCQVILRLIVSTTLNKFYVYWNIVPFWNIKSEQMLICILLYLDYTYLETLL